MLKGLAITPPVIGRISIGRVVERNGKRLPEKDDQFTLTTQVQHPALPVLDLRGQGELVVLFRQALPVALHHPPDRDASDYRRGYHEALQHVALLGVVVG